MTLAIRFVPRPAHDQTPTQRARALCARAMVRVSYVDNSFEVNSSEPAELAKYVLSMTPAERQSIDVNRPITHEQEQQFGVVVAPTRVKSSGWTTIFIGARTDIIALFEMLDRPVKPEPEPVRETRPSAPKPDSVLPPEVVEAGQILKKAAEEAFDKVSPLLFREGRKLARQFGARR